MSTKKTKIKTKKKAPQGNYFILYGYQGYNGGKIEWESVSGPYTSYAKAIKEIEQDACDDGRFGKYMIVEKSADVKVSVQLFAINKKETKVVKK